MQQEIALNSKDYKFCYFQKQNDKLNRIRGKDRHVTWNSEKVEKYFHCTTDR